MWFNKVQFVLLGWMFFVALDRNFWKKARPWWRKAVLWRYNQLALDLLPFQYVNTSSPVFVCSGDWCERLQVKRKALLSRFLCLLGSFSSLSDVSDVVLQREKRTGGVRIGRALVLQGKWVHNGWSEVPGWERVGNRHWELFCTFVSEG